MAVITRQNHKIYNYVKANMETKDISTQTSADDLEDNLNKKRKIDSIDKLDNISIKSDDSITDDDSSMVSYLEDDEGEENDIQELYVKPNIIDMIKTSLLNRNQSKTNVEEIEETFDEEEERYFKSLSKKDIVKRLGTG